MKQILVATTYKRGIDNNESFFSVINKHKDLCLSTYYFFEKPSKLFQNKIEIILNMISCSFMLFFGFNKFRNKKVLCMGGHFAFLLFGKFSFLIGESFHLYLYNFYLHDLGENEIVKRILRFLLKDSKVTLIAQSPIEVEYYSPMMINKVHFVPYCEDKVDENPTKNNIMSDSQNYIFTGGYTNRDYPLIFECAHAMPMVNFVIVMSSLNRGDIPDNIPSNIQMFFDLPAEDFFELQYKSDCIIVPLKKDVGASGQMLCLGAIKRKKPVIYCNLSSISYYFPIKKMGISYERNNIHSLVQAVEYFYTLSLQDISEMVELTYNNYCDNFTRQSQYEQLVKIFE